MFLEGATGARAPSCLSRLKTGPPFYVYFVYMGDFLLKLTRDFNIMSVHGQPLLYHEYLITYTRSSKIITELHNEVVNHLLMTFCELK